MSKFSYTIHTKALASYSGPYVNELKEAEVIKNSKGRIISTGEKTDRLSIAGTDSTYSIAIQILSPEEQAIVNKRGHAGGWKRFFWKPLKLQTQTGEVTILININSAVKRLTQLGLSEKKIREGLDNGTLIDQAQEIYVNQKSTTPNSKVAIYSNIFQDSSLDVQSVDMIHDFFATLNPSKTNSSLQDAYRKIKELTIQGIEHLKRAGIRNVEDIIKIDNFIKSPEAIAWQEEAKKNNKPVYIKAKDHLGQIPRNIQFNPDGTVYLLFNKVSSKMDRLLGNGTYKKAKQALNLMNGTLYARLTQEVNKEEEKQAVLKELEMAARVKNQKGIINTEVSTSIEYVSKSCDVKIGYMQELLNAGDLENFFRPLPFTEKEQFLIAKRVLQGISWLHEQGILHRDIKPGNLFLKTDPNTNEILDCVVADFGFTFEKTDEDKRKEIRALQYLWHPNIMMPFLRVQKGYKF